MEDFILDVEVIVKLRPVTPKTGLKQRGPYERNMTTKKVAAKRYFFGTDANVDTFMANSLKTLTRQWDLLATEPAEGYPTPATPIAATTATLKGVVKDHNVSTVVTFEWGATKDLGTSTAAAESPVSGDTSTAVSLAITGLTASTQYYYRIKMVSGGVTVWSEVATFVTTA